MMIKRVLWLLSLAYLHQVCGQQLECTTTCNEGEYCQEDDCFNCQYGSFMNLKDHKERSCKKWSHNPGRNVAIVKNGSSTEDIVWGCKDGYEKKYTTVDGFECLERQIDLSTEKSSTSTHMTTSTHVVNTTTLSQLPQKEARSDNLNKILLAVLVPVSILLVVVPTAICYWKRKQRREQTDPDPESLETLRSENNSNESNFDTLNRIFHKIVQVIGIQECKKLFWHIEDKSKKFNQNPTLNNDGACYQAFQKWYKLNQHKDHIIINCLIEALAKLEYNFPADIRNLNDFLASLQFHEKLNNEFKKFCLELCSLLSSSDRDSLLNSLQLKEQFTSRSNRDVKTAFQECLAKWSYKYPYIANENNEWKPLTKIQEELEHLDRNDVLGDLPILLKGIHGVIMGIEVRSENNEHASNG